MAAAAVDSFESHGSFAELTRLRRITMDIDSSAGKMASMRAADRAKHRSSCSTSARSGRQTVARVPRRFLAKTSRRAEP